VDHEQHDVVKIDVVVDIIGVAEGAGAESGLVIWLRRLKGDHRETQLGRAGRWRARLECVPP
jgi:hypothetical protein